MTRRLLTTLANLAAVSALAAPAAAQTAPDGVLQAELLGGWRTEAGTQMAGLKLTLAPGWKTYWRAPGDAGIPPLADWTGSENLGAARFHWPVPEVFDLSGMRSIGYAGEVVLPLELVPRDGDGAIRLSGVVDLGICEEICVPVSLRLAADLPVPGAPDAAIRAALDAVPPQVTAPVRCRVEPIRDGLRVTAEITHPALGPGEVAVIEAGDPSVWVSEPVLARAGPVLTAVADLVPVEARPFALDRSAVVITLIGGGKAVELKGCPAG